MQTITIPKKAQRGSKYQDDSFKVGSAFNRVRQCGRWLHGDVVTQYGVVAVVSEVGRTRFDFAANRRHYMRVYDRAFTSRGLATKAGQFAKEITNQIILAVMASRPNAFWKT
jgi:hypothetical protein